MYKYKDLSDLQSSKNTFFFLNFISAPSPPQHPRTFVTYSRDPLNVINYQIKVSLYWLPPEHPNGIVTSYIIYKSRSMDGPWDENIWEPAQNIYLSNQSRADPDRIYYFKVNIIM